MGGAGSGHADDLVAGSRVGKISLERRPAFRQVGGADPKALAIADRLIVSRGPGNVERTLTVVVALVGELHGRVTATQKIGHGIHARSGCCGVVIRVQPGLVDIGTDAEVQEARVVVLTSKIT